MKRQNRIYWTRFAAPLLVAASVALVLPAVLPANAQDQVIRRLPDKPSWSLFGIFGSRNRAGPRRYYDDGPQIQKVAKPRKPKNRVVAPKPAEPEIVAVEKQPDAKTVLVIGDFLASGLAEGLETSFATNPRVRILDRSKGPSGFVRQDVFDWPKDIASLIDAEKPAAIAIMMGSNDRQQMQVNGERQPARSEAWTKEYENRTVALAEAIEDKKIPFVWVSMPAFKSTKMTSDMLAFNTYYKTAAEGGGGEFVDIWDGFVDENGAFVMSGPDVSGQPVRLRSGDGTNLTTAGKAKLAFYTEKPLRKLLGEPSEDGPAVPAIAAPSLTPGTTTPAAVDRTEPMALNDPNLDGATELLGAPSTTPPATQPAAIAGQAPAGRADNFGAAAATPPAVEQPSAALRGSAN